jgi:hypothetical protein
VKTALGFRTHSGWAAVVAIELSPEPCVCDRRTIQLCDPAIPGSKQPFHTAEPMELPKAMAFLKRCEDRSYTLAVDAFKDAAKSLEKRGHVVVACGLMASSGRALPSIEAILASHAAIHSAEGELYRDAIAHACERSRVPLLRIREKEAFAFAEQALGLSAQRIQDRLAAMGRTVGSPWTQDQKLAALAAWVALATVNRKRKAAGQVA